MPKSSHIVASDIREALFKSDINVLTYSWPEFYKACGREKMKEAFKGELSAQLLTQSVVVSYGNAAVIVAKDYNFAPLRSRP